MVNRAPLLLHFNALEPFGEAFRDIFLKNLFSPIPDGTVPW
jgi:hypothetical protein